jgi:hypothetical protein
VIGSVSDRSVTMIWETASTSTGILILSIRRLTARLDVCGEWSETTFATGTALLRAATTITRTVARMVNVIITTTINKI